MERALRYQYGGFGSRTVAPTDAPIPSFTGGPTWKSARTWQRTVQEGTFVLSLIGQITGLVLALVALAPGTIPAALGTVLTLEIVAQGVEFAWYLGVGAMYATVGFSFNVGSRYIDWVFTTPVMLVSIMIYALYESEQCSTAIEILNYGGGSRWVALVIMVVLDLLMLSIGLAYETKWDGPMNFWNFLTPVWTGNENRGLVWGFVPFLGIFATYLPMSGGYKGGGVFSVALTFVLWLLYGLVAVFTLTLGWGASDEEGRDQLKNGAYNVLDVIAKNGVGIYISATALSQNYTNTSACVNGTFVT